MTRAKKADRPHCKVYLLRARGGGSFYTTIEWIDKGKERVSARITKALKSQGIEARAFSVRNCYPPTDPAHPCAEEGHRHCLVITPAPIESVEELVRNYFLTVDVDSTIPTETKYTGETAIDMLLM